MGELFGGGGEGKCPGRESCGVYLNAADDEREKEAACDSAGSYCSRRFQVPPEAQAVVNYIERLAQERRAGFQPISEDLTPLEFELFVLWVEVEEQHRRSHKSNMNELAAILRARAEAGL